MVGCQLISLGLIYWDESTSKPLTIQKRAFYETKATPRMVRNVLIERMKVLWCLLFNMKFYEVLESIFDTFSKVLKVIV